MNRSAPLRRKSRLARVSAKQLRATQLLARSRVLVYKRAGGVCERCGRGDFKRHRLQLHHILPRSRGVGWPGLHKPANLALLCAPCHRSVHEGSPPDRDRWIRRGA